MKYLIFPIVLFLSACTTVPVKQKFPHVPEILREKCPPLVKVKDDEKSITELLKVVVTNYGAYYECANKIEGWTQWYDEQKKIFDEVNK